MEKVCVCVCLCGSSLDALDANANSGKYHETSPVLISYLRTSSGNGGSLCLIASFKSHKTDLTLTGCQSITARTLLMGGTSRGGKLQYMGWGCPRQTELSSAELRCQHP